MPRVKAKAVRRSRSNGRMSPNSFDEVAADETFLDNEEIKRIEKELDSLRREKTRYIQKMRMRERRKMCDNSSVSPFESDLNEDDEQEPIVEARKSTRDLADGFEKAQQRYMFNLRNIEDKYKEREIRGSAESKVEIDQDGNFYFPETMNACRQQAFINRIFHNDILFGKGCVSAPHNSIQSFDGDHRALKKSMLLDQKFCKKMRTSINLDDPYEHGATGATSSSYVSGNGTKQSNSSAASSRHQRSREFYDSVFEKTSESQQSIMEPQKNRHNSISRRNKAYAGANRISSYDDDVFADDEKTIGDDSSEGNFTDEEKEEETLFASRAKQASFSNCGISVSRSPVTRSVVKNEVTSGTPMSITPKASKQISPTTLNTSEHSEHKLLLKLETVAESANVNSKVNILKAKTVKNENEQSNDLKVTTENVEPVGNSSSPLETTISTRSKSVAKLAGQTVDVKLENSDDGSSVIQKKQRSRSDTNQGKKCRNGSPYCKHCELIKEERKKESLKSKVKCVSVEEIRRDLCSESLKVDENTPKVASKKCETKKAVKKVEKNTSTESGSQSKRRSETATVDEPEKKKRKSVDADILSIPSSMAVAVDTELIAAENAGLDTVDLPMFADNSPKPSVWTSSIDNQWIRDMTKARGKKKDLRFFGIATKEYPKDTPIINYWVDNLSWNKNEKDPFDTDFRRIVAKDKKSRIDVKAGYDVRY